MHEANKRPVDLLCWMAPLTHWSDHAAKRSSICRGVTHMTRRGANEVMDIIGSSAWKRRCVLAVGVQRIDNR